MSVYTDLRDAGIPLDNHESDLYAKVTPESRAIVERHYDRPETFRSKVDGTRWYDLPFAFEPYWEAKQRAR